MNETTSYRLRDGIDDLYTVINLDQDGGVDTSYLCFKDGATHASGRPMPLEDGGWVHNFKAYHHGFHYDYDGSDPNPELVAEILAMPEISSAEVGQKLRHQCGLELH
jgi:hypothetical protein